MRTVGQVSELTGVTVRTLHHYDEVGLLPASERSPAGYRLYSYQDLERLQEILLWRALGFSLAEIQELLDDPAHDRVTALRRQRELVARDLERLGATVHAIDAALDAHENGTVLKESTMFEGFDPTEYEEEVRELWGHTEAYRESTRRAASYGDAEWQEIKAEADQIVRDFAGLLRAGLPPDGERAKAVAERHRRSISRWFYPCSVEMHRRMGEMYLADERFGRSYEQVADGLAAYVRVAYGENADAQEALSS